MDYQFVRTTCPYCGCGCQMLLEVLDGELIGTVRHCTAQECSWEEALDFTVSRLKELNEKHGGDSLAFCSSARCTNEKKTTSCKRSVGQASGLTM